MTEVTKQAITQVKIINNNNVLIKSPVDNFPKLIQGASVQNIDISTNTNLITGLNNQSIQSLFFISREEMIISLINIIYQNQHRMYYKGSIQLLLIQ